MAEVVEERGRLDVAGLKALQRDVYVSSSVALRDAIVGRIRGFGLDQELTGDERLVFERMAGWDGHYRAESEGAVAFELFRSAFVGDFYAAALGSTDAAAFAGVGQIKTLLLADLETADPKALAAQLRAALAAAAASIGDFPNWGEMHRLQLGHPLRFVPLLGGRFRFADHPIGGTTESLMKTAHGATNERHATRYGANARHVSDLSDPNGNFFVILGGQDGWLNSSTFIDQVPLWLNGTYVRMPLDLDEVARRFPNRMRLEPSG
jgi:penicillin amidase